MALDAGNLEQPPGRYLVSQALDERHVDGFVEGCLERIEEDDPEWEEGGRERILWRSSRQDARSGRGGFHVLEIGPRRSEVSL
jgi:hypothetical protein